MAAFEVLALDTTTPQIRAPGASDTYTFPRAVELPLGTANGVLYLNGSKVATSGNFLTFDGASFGIGTSTPSARLEVVGGNIRWGNASTSVGQLAYDGGQVYVGSSTSTPVAFTIGGAEQMRLNSTGLGIGTSSPIARLDSRGAAYLGSNSNNSFYVDSSASLVSIGAAGRTAFSTSALAFITSDGASATERMRLDASGNLGLGVTPKAWTVRALELLGSPSLSSVAGTDLTYNAYYDGAWRYAGTAVAARYAQIASTGSHAWFTAPSGTAGNAITFTQAMTLHASGGLSVGTTLDPGVGNISANTTFRLGSFSYSRVADSDGGGGFGGGYNVALNSTGTPRHDSLGAAAAYQYGIQGDVYFLTSGSQAAGTAIPIRLRIDKDGNVIINTAAIATTATNGFLYVPTCAGTPTGTPTTYTGRSPIVVDSTNNKLYFYSGGSWRDAGP